MKRYLITGGAGFIGSNIAAALCQQKNTDVVIVDNFSSGDWRNLLHLDVDVRALEANHPKILQAISRGDFDAVYHEAAITDTTIMDQQRMLNANTDAFADLLAACTTSSTRLIYASSAGTYGNSPAPNRVGAGEEAANIYGFSKLSMDRIAKRYHTKNKAPIIGLRYFNVFGPGEQHKQAAASMMRQLYLKIKAGEQARLFKYGEQMRDFIYIRDVVAANLAALEASQSGICNIGTGTARNFNDIIKALGHSLKQNIEVSYFDNPFDFYQNHTEADLSHSKALLNWTAKWTLEDGIAQYIGLLEEGHIGPINS